MAPQFSRWTKKLVKYSISLSIILRRPPHLLIFIIESIPTKVKAQEPRCRYQLFPQRD